MDKRRILTPADNWFNLSSNHAGQIFAGKTIYHLTKNTFESWPLTSCIQVKKGGEELRFEQLSFGPSELAAFCLQQTSSLANGINASLAKNVARGIFLNEGAGVWFDNQVIDFWFLLDSSCRLQLAASYSDGDLSTVSCLKENQGLSTPTVEIGDLPMHKIGLPYQISDGIFEGNLQIVDARLTLRNEPNFRFNPSGGLLNLSQATFNFDDQAFITLPRCIENTSKRAIEAVYLVSAVGLYYSRQRYDASGNFVDFSHGYLKRLKEPTREIFRLRSVASPQRSFATSQGALRVR